jgi:crotonobetainyl-CoA:carnitine CoA-transferase CaiB-like acyl-CoA transferase
MSRLAEDPAAGAAARLPAGPLTGIRVVDLSSYLAGPFGCTLLADLGAEVIKVEAPAGDTIRNFPPKIGTESRVFVGVNRGKLGVAIDLKRPEGLAALDRLVERADVLVHNFRPAVPARLGIDYDRLRARNPRLIYCSLSGFGDTGPLAGHAGFDQVLQSMTGVCTFQGAAAGVPQVVLGSPVDYYSSALLAYAVSSALFHRERTGEGQYVSLSLLRSALTMQSARFVWAESEDRNASRDLRTGISGVHPTKDGYIYISAHSAHFWQALCERVGLPDLATDSRYDTLEKRSQHADELVARLHAALQAHTAYEWEEIFGQQVPCSAVRPIEDMFDHPQVLAEDLVKTVTHPVVGRYRGMGKPIKFSATPGPEPTAAPTFGQHTDQVLEDYGYSKEEIQQLRAAGVVS